MKKKKEKRDARAIGLSRFVVRNKKESLLLLKLLMGFFLCKGADKKRVERKRAEGDHSSQ